MAKTIVVNAAVKTLLTNAFPASTDATVAAGLTAAQITFLGELLGKELQSQSSIKGIKDVLTRIMAAT